MKVDCRDCKHRRIIDMVRNRNGEFMPVYQCQKGKTPKKPKHDELICICEEYEWRGG